MEQILYVFNSTLLKAGRSIWIIEIAYLKAYWAIFIIEIAYLGATYDIVDNIPKAYWMSYDYSKSC